MVDNIRFMLNASSEPSKGSAFCKLESQSTYSLKPLTVEYFNFDFLDRIHGPASFITPQVSDVELITQDAIAAFAAPSKSSSNFPSPQDLENTFNLLIDANVISGNDVTDSTALVKTEVNIDDLSAIIESATSAKKPPAVKKGKKKAKVDTTVSETWCCKICGAQAKDTPLKRVGPDNQRVSLSFQLLDTLALMIVFV
jgi:hypothetical protein